MSGATRNIARFVEFGKKIVCVGRNYSEHAAELGNPVPKKPILFLKPSTAYVSQGQTIQIPPECTSLHHEVELGIVIGKQGSCISEADAMNHVGGYVLALDMTARDFQDEAKTKGQPWSVAKGFDTSCPVGDFIEKEKLGNPGNVNLWLKVNNEMRQNGSTKDMIFSIPYLVSYISRYFSLEAGDLVLTGTPSGVGPVKQGDIIEAGIADISKIKFVVNKRT
ncbi:acylpyruvase FAHD1, mitochondrial-like [Gigantopelta aegis]|uniref:acylpyruvase FAHD1, mitochondrial-like n=1 Tax=Gigantopelta aegis TaxID=1735272 RepID=UPI001B88D0D3|nr:acylpyruvase FAHD1, mitochondrial-like [Gigantopelta aegis]